MSCAYDPPARATAPAGSSVGAAAGAGPRSGRGHTTAALSPSRARPVAAALLSAVLGLTACSAGGAARGDEGLRATSSPGPPSASPVPDATAAPPPGAGASPSAVAPPPAGTGTSPAAVAALRERREADVLVVSPAPLPAAVRERLSALSRPGGIEVFRAGTAVLGGAAVRTVGVDPSSFRAWTADATAESDPVWRAVARGEAVASHEVATARRLGLGSDLSLQGAGSAAASMRLGALATTGIPRADLVLDAERARRLGLPEASAALLEAPEGVDPVGFAAQVREVAGQAAVDLLDVPAPVARLTGGSAAEELGAFSYRYFADGTIEPDARWVRDNIRTETVPVMGRVTCHRLMLPQLRGALTEVVDAGLAGTLKTYSGCYVPRFIERNPARSISLHTWGIAIDMDAATNYRGIRGTMDSRVVEIFKRWGFRWGGDWRYTDPMHFELGTLLTAPPAG